MIQDRFVDAIKHKKKVRLTYIAKENGLKTTKICAPLDYGPKRLAHNQCDRFHLWDFDSDPRHHILSLLPDKIIKIEVLAEEFSPEDFVAWPTNWFTKRNWGRYS